MSYIKEALLAYCDLTGANPSNPATWPTTEEMYRVLAEGIQPGDRLGWTDEQMREVDHEARNNGGR